MMNLQEMRKILSEQVNKLLNDETTPSKANAVTNACGKILSSLVLEMSYDQAMGRTKKILFLEEPKTKQIEAKPEK